MPRNLLIFPFIALFLTGCDCEEGFLQARDEMLTQFENAFRNPDELPAFKASLESFLAQYEGVSCQDDSVRVDPTQEVKSTLSFLNSTGLNSTGAPSAKAIYGPDDRFESDRFPADRFKQLSRGVAALFRNENIGPNLEIVAEQYGQRFQLCQEVPFREQLSASLCTGALISPQHILTAGHCANSSQLCENTKWVFDYREGTNRLDENKIYGCESVQEYLEDEDTGIDFALIKLDRRVNDRKFLKIRTYGKVPDRTSVVVIGHPMGLPMKTAGNALIRDNSNPYFFVSNLDAFSGNSGSPVFNKNTGVVEGILVRGESDFFIRRDVGAPACREEVKFTDGEGEGEDVLRTASLLNLPNPKDPLELYKGFFEESLYPIELTEGLPFQVYEFSEARLMGMKFLGRCGLFWDQDPIARYDLSFGKCENYADFSSTLDAFIDELTL